MRVYVDIKLKIRVGEKIQAGIEGYKLLDDD
jgi:hypothetical protein